jgi:hypothetical protein
MDSEQSPDYLDMQMRLLGQIIYWSATLESTLRSAFCSLVGSKFAAIVAAEMPASQLIDLCKALTNAHREMSEPHRAAILEALKLCKSANEKRNILVHAVKTGVAANDGSFQTIKPRRKDYKTTVGHWTPQTLTAACQELAQADLNLFGALQAAVSSEIMVLDQALGWEDQLPPDADESAP